MGDTTLQCLISSPSLLATDRSRSSVACLASSPARADSTAPVSSLIVLFLVKLTSTCRLLWACSRANWFFLKVSSSATLEAIDT